MYKHAVSSVQYGCESWTIKKAECQWIEAFELRCWRLSPEYSLEGLKLKLKFQYFGHSFLYGPTLISIRDYWKTITLIGQTFVSKVTSLLFNMLSGLLIAFLPRSKCLLISWLQSPCAVILEPKIIKSVTVSPSICYEVLGPEVTILVSECWVLSKLFHFPLTLSSRGFLVPLCFLTRL